MPAWRHGFLDRAAPGVDQVLGRKYLRRGDDIVLARGEQEYRATQIEESILRPSATKRPLARRFSLNNCSTTCK